MARIRREPQRLRSRSFEVPLMCPSGSQSLGSTLDLLRLLRKVCEGRGSSDGHGPDAHADGHVDGHAV